MRLSVQMIAHPKYGHTWRVWDAESDTEIMWSNSYESCVGVMETMEQYEKLASTGADCVSGSSSDVLDLVSASGLMHPDDCVDRASLRFEATLQLLLLLLAVCLAILMHRGVVGLWRTCWSGFC